MYRRASRKMHEDSELTGRKAWKWKGVQGGSGDAIESGETVGSRDSVGWGHGDAQKATAKLTTALIVEMVQLR